MSCSECLNWDKCSFVEYSTDKLIRPCFKGKTVRLDVSAVDDYKDKHSHYVLVENIIMLGMHKTSEDRKFLVKSLVIKAQNGAKYVCDIVYLPIYFSSSKRMFTFYVKGFDFSMSIDRVKELFNVVPSERVANTGYSPFFTPKDDLKRIEERRIANIEYEKQKELAKERRRQRFAQNTVAKGVE